MHFLYMRIWFLYFYAALLKRTINTQFLLAFMKTHPGFRFDISGPQVGSFKYFHGQNRRFRALEEGHWEDF
jgi:hypothetical protein